MSLKKNIKRTINRHQYKDATNTPSKTPIKRDDVKKPIPVNKPSRSMGQPNNYVPVPKAQQSPAMEHNIKSKSQLQHQHLQQKSVDDSGSLTKAYIDAVRENNTAGEFKPIENYDYHVVILISSYQRYDKLQPMLKQLYSQPTKYKFKVILLNDNSPDIKYDYLDRQFPKLEYHKNRKNHGRKFYWYTVTKLWNYSKVYNSDTVLMMDDDFILADGFLDVLLDTYYELKSRNNNIIAIAPHLHTFAENKIDAEWWYNTFSIDGIGLLSRDLLRSFDYQLDPVTEEQFSEAAHAHGWSQIQKRIVELRKIAYKTKHSIAMHVGNESMLGKGVAKKSMAYTKRYKGSNLTKEDLIY